MTSYSPQRDISAKVTSTDHVLKVKSPRMALTGDLAGGQETQGTGVRLACRSDQRAPWGP